MPNIADFKIFYSFKRLYEEIPYFGVIFRYCFTTQYLGYFAIPIAFYYLSVSRVPYAFYSFLLSFSSLISGIGNYNRSQILTFSLIFIFYYFLVRGSIAFGIQKKIKIIFTFLFAVILFYFLINTYKRISAMEYYGDRIPPNSYIKNPSVFNLFDYASMSHSNGLNQLDNFSNEKKLNGEQFLYPIIQILSFFRVIQKDYHLSKEKISLAYNDGGMFNGYATNLVFNFGYFSTFIISLIYYAIVKGILKKKRIISINNMLFIVFLLIIPVTSIFYFGYPIFIIPGIFFIFVSILYFFKILILKRPLMGTV